MSAEALRELHAYFLEHSGRDETYGSIAKRFGVSYQGLSQIINSQRFLDLTAAQECAYMYQEALRCGACEQLAQFVALATRWLVINRKWVAVMGGLKMPPEWSSLATPWPERVGALQLSWEEVRAVLAVHGERVRSLETARMLTLRGYATLQEAPDNLRSEIKAAVDRLVRKSVRDREMQLTGEPEERLWLRDTVGTAWASLYPAWLDGELDLGCLEVEAP